MNETLERIEKSIEYSTKINIDALRFIPICELRKILDEKQDKSYVIERINIYYEENRKK